MIRPAGAADSAWLAQVHAATFDHPWSAAEFSELLAGGAEAAIADDDGFILWRSVAGEAEILTFAVLPGRRRAGAGRALLAEALARASASAEAMFLEVAEDNAPAIGLYRAAGFREAGRRRAYYRTASGEMRDALILRRALNSDG